MRFKIPGDTGWVVCHDSWQDGGGTWFGQEYLEILDSRYQRRWHNCLEWCSGPGFIGFALLAHGLCKRLTLQDLHEPIIEHVKNTCDINSCHDRVEFYLGHSLTCIPEQKFDLIIANPPHYLECPGDANYQRLAVDQGWQAHRDFYQHAHRYLAPDGVILMQENQAGSLGGVTEFWNMIHSNHLEVTAYWTSPGFWNVQGPTQIYYIEIQHRR